MLFDSSNKVAINLMSIAILRDILETGTFIFFSLIKVHSNPHAISLSDVVNVKIRNNVTIYNNLTPLIIARFMFNVIKNTITKTKRYITHTLKAFDRYARKSIFVNPITNVKNNEKSNKDT